MAEKSFCEVCGETYNVDNLQTCKNCRKDYCYQCGGSDSAYCKYCDNATLKKDKTNSPAKA